MFDLEKNRFQQAIDWYKKRLTQQKEKKEKIRPEKFEFTFEDNTQYFCDMLIGKNIEIANQIVSRIDSRVCVANQICALAAFEDYLGIAIDDETQKIREILLSAEIIRTHMHQMFFEIHNIYSEKENLNLFLDDNKKIYQNYSKIISVCNETIEYFGARSIHPTSLALGGFENRQGITPEQKKMMNEKLIREWKVVTEKCVDITLSSKRFYFPQLEENYEFVSMTKIDDTPLIGGVVQKPIKKNDLVIYGPIARVNNNIKLLSREADKISKKIGLKMPITNPYHALVCMCIESVHLSEKIIVALSHETASKVKEKKLQTKKGEDIASANVESAFGLIRHVYKIDENKTITQASIMHPQKVSAMNLKSAVEKILKKESGQEGIKKARFLLKLYYI